MITVTRKVDFRRRPDRTVAAVVAPPVTLPPPRPRVPRISKLMALAIDLDARLRRGEFRTQQQLADALHISQPRLTQLLNLTLLAPDIQEDVLFTPTLERGRSGVHERAVRRITAELDWQRQRALWRQLTT